MVEPLLSEDQIEEMLALIENDELLTSFERSLLAGEIAFPLPLKVGRLQVNHSKSPGTRAKGKGNEEKRAQAALLTLEPLERVTVVWRDVMDLPVAELAPVTGRLVNYTGFSARPGASCVGC